MTRRVETLWPQNALDRVNSLNSAGLNGNNQHDGEGKWKSQSPGNRRLYVQTLFMVSSLTGPPWISGYSLQNWSVMRWRDTLKVDYVALQTACCKKCCSESVCCIGPQTSQTLHWSPNFPNFALVPKLPKLCIISQTQQIPPKASLLTAFSYVTEEAEFEIY